MLTLCLQAFDLPVALDQALDLEKCLSALQEASADLLSYALMDDYNSLLAVIANDVQMTYYVVAFNQTNEAMTRTELSLVQGYCVPACCKIA